jgi:hypothetical protein
MWHRADGQIPDVGRHIRTFPRRSPPSSTAIAAAVCRLRRPYGQGHHRDIEARLDALAAETRFQREP